MKILFVHQSFPGQYFHLAQRLAAHPGNEIVFITQRQNGELPGVRKILYHPRRTGKLDVHNYPFSPEAAALNAQEVARAALELRRSGFIPDVMAGHNRWGEIWGLKDVFPEAPLLGCFDSFHRAEDSDGVLLKLDAAGLDVVDLGQCPTEWQRSRYPAEHQSRLHVVHDGIDTASIGPDPQARLRLPDGRVLTANDEVVTYVAHNFEQRGGFPSFMRSLPEALARRPEAHVVIVGGDEGGSESSVRDMMLQELADSLDLSRVHFLGWTAHPTYLKALQASRAHVYLTYPLALSRSMLEAMSAQCLVIGSRTPSVEEVIRHGENGLLVDLFDAHELAETIVNALAEPEAFARARVNARRTLMERYDLNAICLPKQVSLLSELKEGSPAGQPASTLVGPPRHQEPERQKPSECQEPSESQKSITSLNDALLLLSRWRSASLRQSFVQQCGSTVLGGVVKGMSFLPTSIDGSHISKLLGCYKQPLQPHIEAAVHVHYPIVLVLGGSEGYFAVGMARRMPGTRVLTFDVNPQARQACVELAARNGVAQRVTVGAGFSPEDFARYAGEQSERPVLALCDVEGAESELLDPAKTPALAEMDLIVEAHEYLTEGITELLAERFGATHSVAVVEDNGERQAPRGLTWFNKLSHLDQLLAKLEWRPGPAPWLVMKSKARGYS
jgi:glycosyltransferase involved in cell wall biosynthesis